MAIWFAGRPSWRSLGTLWPKRLHAWVLVAVIASIPLYEATAMYRLAPVFGDEIDGLLGLSWRNLPEVIATDYGLPGLVYTSMAGPLFLILGLGALRVAHLLVIVGHAIVLVRLWQALGGGGVVLLVGALILAGGDAVMTMARARPHALANLLVLVAVVCVALPEARARRGLVLIMLGIAGLDNPAYAPLVPTAAVLLEGPRGLDDARGRLWAGVGVYVAALAPLSIGAVWGRAADDSASGGGVPPLEVWLALLACIGVWFARPFVGSRLLRMLSPTMVVLSVGMAIGVLDLYARYAFVPWLVCVVVVLVQVEARLPWSLPPVAAVALYVLGWLFLGPSSALQYAVSWRQNVEVMAGHVVELVPASDVVVVAGPERPIEIIAVLENSVTSLASSRYIMKEGVELVSEDDLLPLDEDAEDVWTLRVHWDWVLPLPDACETFIDLDAGELARCPADVLIP